MRIVLRLLSCVVIASATITVWTRAALVFAPGPQLTSTCLWIAAGGSLCAVFTLAGTRKQGRRQRSPRPAARYAARGDCGRGSRPGPPANPADRDATAPADRRCGSRVGRELFSTRPGPDGRGGLDPGRRVRPEPRRGLHAQRGLGAGRPGAGHRKCAGTVQADPAGRLAAGTAVVAILGGMGRIRNGSYAELVTVPASNVVPVRTSLPWTDLVALPEVYATAWAGLHQNPSLRPGQTVLVRGGTSALGQAAVNVAAEEGMTVIATTRNPSRADLLPGIGAAQVVAPTAAASSIRPVPTTLSPISPGADQASARPRRPHQRIRAGSIEAQVDTSDRVLEPHRTWTSPGRARCGSTPSAWASCSAGHGCSRRTSGPSAL